MKSGLVVHGGQNVLPGTSMLGTKMVHVGREPIELYVPKVGGVHVKHSSTLL